MIKTFETENSRYEFDTEAMVYRRTAIVEQEPHSERLNYDEWIEYTEFAEVGGRIWFNTPGGVYGVFTSSVIRRPEDTVQTT